MSDTAGRLHDLITRRPDSLALVGDLRLNHGTEEIYIITEIWQNQSIIKFSPVQDLSYQGTKYYDDRGFLRDELISRGWAPHE